MSYYQFTCLYKYCHINVKYQNTVISSVTVIKIIIQGDVQEWLIFCGRDGNGQVDVQLPSIFQYGCDELCKLNNIFMVVLITIHSTFSKM